MNKKNISLIFLLLFSVTINCLLYRDYVSKKILLEEKTELTSYYDELTQNLQKEIRNYQYNYSQLNQEKIELNQYTEKLEKIQQELETENANLAIQVDEMDTEISSINERLYFEKYFQIGNSLTSFYDLLRYEYGLDGGTGSGASRKEIRFAVKLVSHDLGNSEWTSLEDEYYRKS